MSHICPEVKEADYCRADTCAATEFVPAHYRIDTSRLEEVKARILKRGAHADGDEMCVMEAVAYVAGEPWSDKPQCACPVISVFMRFWNDSLGDEGREQLLKPLIPSLVGSRSTPQVEERRSYLALDWLIRVCTPKWFDLVPSLHEHAKALRELDAIADMAGAAAGVKVRAAWAAAWAAAVAAAAGAALKPTTEWLQASALDLVRRMLEVTE